MTATTPSSRGHLPINGLRLYHEVHGEAFDAYIEKMKVLSIGRVDGPGPDGDGLSRRRVAAHP